MIKFYITLICAILTFGCTSSNEQRYSLVEDLSISAVSENLYKVNLNISGVSDSGGIILQTSEVTVNEALSNRWSFDLGDQLTVLLKDALYKNKVSTDYSFDVLVYRFQGSYLGEAQVAALFVVKNKNDKIILNKDFTAIKDLTKDGYAELVLKLKEAWQDITLKAINSLP